MAWYRLNGDVIADIWIHEIHVMLKSRGDLRDHNMVANLLNIILWRGNEVKSIVIITSP